MNDTSYNRLDIQQIKLQFVLNLTLLKLTCSMISDDSGRQQKIKKTTVYKIVKHRKKSAKPPQTLDKVTTFIPFFPNKK